MCAVYPSVPSVSTYAAQMQSARANEMLARMRAAPAKEMHAQTRAPMRLADRSPRGVAMRDFPSWLAGLEINGPDGSAHREALADVDRRIAAVLDQVRSYTFGGGFGGPDAERI